MVVVASKVGIWPNHPDASARRFLVHIPRGARSVHNIKRDPARCKQLFTVRANPQSRISIHRCYKRYPAGAKRGVWRGGSRGFGAGLCRILDMNFREINFYEVRE